MRVDTGYSRKARIEMIPLMDIVFILLVFFIYAMVTMTVGKQGMAVNLSSESTAVKTAEDWTVISIGADGGYYWARDPVALEDVKVRVKQIRAVDPSAGVYIKADRAAASGRTLDLMNALREAGCTNFVFVTEKEAP